MNQFISSLSVFGVLLVAAGPYGLRAQQPDHLSMNIQYEDSALIIKASYRSPASTNRDSVYFLLNPAYALDAIESRGLKSYKVTQQEGIPLPYYLLEFDVPRDSAVALNVMFDYRIDLREQNHMRSDWIELNADKLWFPNLGGLNNELTYEVTISDFPESYFMITHTDAQVDREKNTLTIKKEVPWYEVLVLAGRDLKEWQYDRNITVVGSDEIADSTCRSIGDKVKNSIDVLNQYFGTPDPITSFVVVLRNTRKDELGFQFNRRNLIVTGTDFNDYGNLSHEIAHYWWSRANFIDEPWMNESFANYSMYVVLKEFASEDYERLLATNRKVAETAIPVSRASLFTTDAYNSYYHKGAVHLLSLEEKIGSERMRELLSSCVRNDINTTEGFLEELERLTDKGSREFFEDLLRT